MTMRHHLARQRPVYWDLTIRLLQQPTVGFIGSGPNAGRLALLAHLPPKQTAWRGHSSTSVCNWSETLRDLRHKALDHEVAVVVFAGAKGNEEALHEAIRATMTTARVEVRLDGEYAPMRALAAVDTVLVTPDLAREPNDTHRGFLALPGAQWRFFARDPDDLTLIARWVRALPIHNGRVWITPRPDPDSGESGSAAYERLRDAVAGRHWHLNADPNPWSPIDAA